MLQSICGKYKILFCERGDNMPKKLKEESLESLVAQIQELLNELTKEQNNLANDVKKHHKATMKKLDKLREFDEIADMTNQVFERRISNIEQAVSQMLRTKEK